MAYRRLRYDVVTLHTSIDADYDEVEPTFFTVVYFPEAGRYNLSDQRRILAEIPSSLAVDRGLGNTFRDYLAPQFRMRKK